MTPHKAWRESVLSDVSPAWIDWCKRWRQTSTLAPRTRERTYYALLSVGRWLTRIHPQIDDPKHWTRETALDYVAAVDKMQVGDFTHIGRLLPQLIGKPLTPATKNNQLAALRSFFRDCQEWGWVRRNFDPARVFATPRAVKALIGPNPRVVADDVWAKLLWAGLNLTEADVAVTNSRAPERAKLTNRYPLEMIRAMIFSVAFRWAAPRRADSPARWLCAMAINREN